MRALEVVTLLAHLGVGVLWVGSMAYSLFVVQPRIAALMPGAAEAEEVYRTLAAGNRWRVVGLIAALWVTGGALLALHNGPTGTAWWLAIAAKVLLLAAASGLCWWVSWRGWPRRVFALPAELPAEQARFRRVALAMAVLVGAAFLLGALLTALG